MNSYRSGHKITTLDFRPEDDATTERIKVLTVRSEEKDKLPALAQLLGQIGQESSVVFLNYRDAVERVTDYLLEQGFSAISYHGALEQKSARNIFIFLPTTPSIRLSVPIWAAEVLIYPISTILSTIICLRANKIISTESDVRHDGIKQEEPSFS